MIVIIKYINHAFITIYQVFLYFLGFLLFLGFYFFTSYQLLSAIENISITGTQGVQPVAKHPASFF